jgi:hypothetical protein
MRIRLDQSLAIRRMRIMTLSTVGTREVDSAVRLAWDTGRLVTTLAQFARRLRQQAAVRRLVRRVTREAFTITRGQMLDRFCLPCFDFLSVACTAQAHRRTVNFRIIEDLTNRRALHLPAWTK